jgi:hypothetical protein
MYKQEQSREKWEKQHPPPNELPWRNMLLEEKYDIVYKVE